MAVEINLREKIKEIIIIMIMIIIIIIIIMTDPMTGERNFMFCSEEEINTDTFEGK